MRASSSFASSGTSSPRDARGTVSFGPSCARGAAESVSPLVGMSTRFGRGGPDLRPGFIYRSVKVARISAQAAVLFTWGVSVVRGRYRALAKLLGGAQ